MVDLKLKFENCRQCGAEIGKGCQSCQISWVLEPHWQIPTFESTSVSTQEEVPKESLER